MIPAIRLFRVALPLGRAIPVKSQTAHSREILRIEKTLKDGRVIWADCSPLPGFHQETFAECLLSAQAYFSNPDRASDLASPISLKTALEALEWLTPPPRGEHWPDAFENSALLRVPERRDFDAVLESVAEARVCKVKIGPHDGPGSREFLKALGTVRADREIRIDFNQALDAGDSATLRDLIQGLPVAYIEEPCADPRQLKALARVLPIGLDESLGRDSELDALAKAWIVKPNCLGWTESLRRFEQEGPQQKVLSNVFESLSTLQLYAFAYRQRVTKPQALGFGTAFYMADDALPGTFNPKAYQGPWPSEALAPREGHQEILLWEG